MNYFRWHAAPSMDKKAKLAHSFLIWYVSADFLWSSVKENVDGSPPIAFDRDGLELAFKYFCSTTLTMRLAGITQINSHISLFNEMCNAESVVEVENVGLQLAGKENQKRDIQMTQKIKEYITESSIQVNLFQKHLFLHQLTTISQKIVHWINSSGHENYKLCLVQ